MTHTFGDRLRELRTERGLLQREAEEALNLRPGTFSQYERGLREPGFDLLINIAEFFDTSVDYLLGRPAAPRESFALAEARRRFHQALEQAAAGMAGLPTGDRLAHLLHLAEATEPAVFDLDRLARRLRIPARALRKGQVRLQEEVLLEMARHLGISPKWVAAER